MAELDVEFPPVIEPGTTTFTHDLALDGDENLHVGDRVQLTDGVVTVPGVVTSHADGYWFLRVVGHA